MAAGRNAKDGEEPRPGNPAVTGSLYSDKTEQRQQGDRRPHDLPPPRGDVGEKSADKERHVCRLGAAELAQWHTFPNREYKDKEKRARAQEASEPPENGCENRHAALRV